MMLGGSRFYWFGFLNGLDILNSHSFISLEHLIPFEFLFDVRLAEGTALRSLLLLGKYMSGKYIGKIRFSKIEREYSNRIIDYLIKTVLVLQTLGC